MATDVCLVRVRRKPPKWGWPIDVGHEWLEIVDAAGTVTFSAGFYPTGNIWGSAGKVVSPDGYPPGTAGLATIDVSRTPPGKGTAFGCDDKSCDDIRQCVRNGVSDSQADPGAYSLPVKNCRHWVTFILTGCCVIK